MLRWKALLWNEVSLHIYFLRGLVSCRRGQRTNSLGKSSTTKSLQYLPKYSRISFCYLSSQYFVVIIASPCYFYAKESDFRCWCRWFENTLSPSEGKGQAVNTARCTHDKHCWQLLTHICHRYVNCCLPEMGTVWPRSKGFAEYTDLWDELWGQGWRGGEGVRWVCCWPQHFPAKFLGFGPVTLPWLGGM